MIDRRERATLIYKALSEYECVTARELSKYIKRKYGEDIPALSIGAALRKFEGEGKVSKSDCGIGTHYWVNK